MNKIIKPFNLVYNQIEYTIFQNMELVRVVTNKYDAPAIKFCDMPLMFKILADEKSKI